MMETSKNFFREATEISFITQPESIDLQSRILIRLWNCENVVRGLKNNLASLDMAPWKYIFLRLWTTLFTYEIEKSRLLFSTIVSFYRKMVVIINEVLV